MYEGGGHMRENLRNKCDLFAENYKAFSKNLKWGCSISNKQGALLYTMDNRTADIEAIQHCQQIIKNNTGLFSQFRDTVGSATALALSLHEEPELTLKNALDIYNGLKQEGFHSSPYLVLSALSIALQAEPYRYQQIIKSAKNFYDAMKSEHRFLTSSGDYGFAALLAMSDKAVEPAIREIETCHRLLKQDFSTANTVQALAQILSFGEENAAAKCKRVFDLYQALKIRKCKPDRGLRLSFLGMLALLQTDTEILADEIAGVCDYIKEIKGFGPWSASTSERVMFSSVLVCDGYLDDTKKGMLEMVLANNITALLLAQQSDDASSAAAAVIMTS
jgi:hypothetical protein